MAAFDFKKEYKDLYLPGTAPMEIAVPEMTFLMVDGAGDPNDPAGEYRRAAEILYTLSYTVKMSKMGGKTPAGYFDYTVPPLEGLWWFEDEAFTSAAVAQKEKYCWTSMIRQPEFVTQEVFAWACSEAQRKKGLACDKARLVQFEEGLCVQCMHLGPYGDEPETLARIHRYMTENGLEDDTGLLRRHHEIYLNDPTRTAPDKLKTVLRHPMRRK